MHTGARATFNGPEAKAQRSKEGAVKRRPSGVATALGFGARYLPLMDSISELNALLAARLEPRVSRWLTPPDKYASMWRRRKTETLRART